MKVKELKDALYLKYENDLMDFIEENFTVKLQNQVTIKNNINTLKYLDEKDIRYAIARMKKIEENNDVSKRLFSLTPYILAIFAGYVSLFTFSINWIASLIGLIALVYIFFIVYKQSNITSSIRGNATLFRSLLESIELNKKEI